MNHFKETQYFYPLLIFYGCQLLFTLVVLLQNENVGLTLSMILTSAILTLLVYITGKMSLCITDKELVVRQGFGFKTDKFLLSTIDKASISTERLPWWYGLGNKMAGNNVTFFRIRFDELVKFKEKNNPEKYYFSVKDKERFIKLLQEIKS